MAGRRKTSRRSADEHRDSYHHGDLKRALTDAALSLVAEKGPKGFTLTEAARRAGVSAAAPYRHFSDKDQLLAAAAEQGFLQLHAALTAAIDRARDPKRRLVTLGRAYVRWAVTHPDYYQIMFAAHTVRSEHHGLVSAAALAFDDLLEATTTYLASGTLRGRDSRRLASALWSLVHGIASLSIGGDLDQAGIQDDPAALAARAVADHLRSTPPTAPECTPTPS
ncbi:MAG: TetR/AcrR family transcriptional regulator [Mycobacterium sp.]|nr:TetR/AcrR family transcriptional regulator [Mycobacterium sp.]